MPPQGHLRTPISSVTSSVEEEESSIEEDNESIAAPEHSPVSTAEKQQPVLLPVHDDDESSFEEDQVQQAGAEVEQQSEPLPAQVEQRPLRSEHQTVELHVDGDDDSTSEPNRPGMILSPPGDDHGVSGDEPRPAVAGHHMPDLILSPPVEGDDLSIDDDFGEEEYPPAGQQEEAVGASEGPRKELDPSKMMEAELKEAIAQAKSHLGVASPEDKPKLAEQLSHLEQRLETRQKVNAGITRIVTTWTTPSATSLGRRQLQSDLRELRGLMREGGYRFEIEWTDDQDNTVRVLGNAVDQMDKMANNKRVKELLFPNPSLYETFQRTYLEAASGPLREEISSLAGLAKGTLPGFIAIAQKMSYQQRVAFRTGPKDTELKALNSLDKEAVESLDEPTIDAYLKHCNLLDHGDSLAYRKALLVAIYEQQSANAVQRRQRSVFAKTRDRFRGENDSSNFVVRGLQGPMSVGKRSFEEKVAIIVDLQKAVSGLITDPKGFVKTSKFAPVVSDADKTLNEQLKKIGQKPLPTKGETALVELDQADFAVAYSKLSGALGGTFQAQRNFQNDVAKTMIRDSIDRLRNGNVITASEYEERKKEFSDAYKDKNGRPVDSGDPEVLVRLLNYITEKLGT